MRLLIIAAVLGCVALGRSPLSAQRTVQLGLGGGASLPQGSLGSGVSTGWHALGSIVVGVPMLPLGLRVDGAYNHFELEGGAGEQTLASATANLTYRLPTPGSPFSPYLIAGAGGYQAACRGGAACPGSTRAGWNAGLGTRVMLLGVRAFVEGRYHSASRAAGQARYVPVTLGVTL